MDRLVTWTGFDPIASTRKRYVVTRPAVWEIGRKGSGKPEIIPVGFEFDFSVPRLLEWLVDPHDADNLAAAALHDWLLDDGYDRPFSASEFRRVLVARGVKSAKAWVKYFAVLFWTITVGSK